MSYSNYQLNQRLTYIEYILSLIYPTPPSTANLSDILTNGNSAGTHDINMNNQNITSANQITCSQLNYTTLNPPVAGGSQNLSQVLTTGNTANNSITLTDGSKTTDIQEGILTLTNTNIGTPALNINTNSTGINFLDMYNQRTAQTGENNRITFNAKNNIGTKIPYGMIHGNSPNINSGSERGKLDLDVLQSGGMTTYISANGNTTQVDIFKTLHLNGQDITEAPTINCLDNLGNTYRYNPNYDITAISNTPINIPASTISATTKYTNTLFSVPVPTIDKLQSYGSGISTENILCSCWTGSGQYIGTNTGNVYYWDDGLQQWINICNMDGAIKNMVFVFNNLYICGDFTNCYSPSSITGYGFVGFFSGSPTSATAPSQIVWSNYSSYGFNDKCNAMATDGNYLYFGGFFTYDNTTSVFLNHFAVYDYNGYLGSSGYLYGMNNNYGDGFDNTVWNLAFAGGYLCATGEFNNVIQLGTYTQSDFCIGVSISGYTSSSAQQFFGITNALSSSGGSITSTSLIATDGSNFYIGTASTYGGINYLYGIPYYSFSSPFSVGGNNFNNTITSLWWNGAVNAVTASNSFYSAGNLEATLPFGAFTFYNYGLNSSSYKTTIYSQGNGIFYNFAGSNANTFTLQGGRIILYNGTGYSGGVLFPNGALGYTCQLYWNGTAYYILGGSGFAPF